MSKDFWKSKTLVFNALALIVAVALHYGYDAFQPDPNVGPIAAGIAAVIAVLTPLLNMLLRLVTRQPISLSAAGGKTPWVSKTLGFNVLALAVALASSYGFGEFVPAPEVKTIASGIVAMVAVLLPILDPIINILLRFMTSQPITIKR